MGSSSGNSGKTTSIRRFAPYIEETHTEFLAYAYAQVLALQDTPPTYEEIGTYIPDAFFGYGYLISSFPSLFDMYGKFMAGMDIEDVWLRLFEERLSHEEINDAASAESTLETERTNNSVVAYQIAMREANAVGSSTFVIGRSNIEKALLLRISNFRTNLKMELLINDKSYNAYLNWNHHMISAHAILMKYYYHVQHMGDKLDRDHAAYDTLWPLSISQEFGRYLGLTAGLGTVQMLIDPKKRSLLSRNLAMLSQAIYGAMFGMQWGPYGALGGAVIGTQIGETQMLMEQGRGELAWIAWVDPLIGMFLVNSY